MFKTIKLLGSSLKYALLDLFPEVTEEEHHANDLAQELSFLAENLNANPTPAELLKVRSKLKYFNAYCVKHGINPQHCPDKCSRVLLDSRLKNIKPDSAEYKEDRLREIYELQSG